MAKLGLRDVAPAKGSKSGWDVTQPGAKQLVSSQDAGEPREGCEA